MAKHAALRNWLEDAGVGQHAELLITEGFETVEELVDGNITTADLKELGLKMRSRLLLLKALEAEQKKPSTQTTACARSKPTAPAAEKPASTSPPAPLISASSRAPRDAMPNRKAADASRKRTASEKPASASSLPPASSAASPPRNATPPDARRARTRRTHDDDTSTSDVSAAPDVEQIKALDALRAITASGAEVVQDIDRLMRVCSAAQRPVRSHTRQHPVLPKGSSQAPIEVVELLDSSDDEEQREDQPRVVRSATGHKHNRSRSEGQCEEHPRPKRQATSELQTCHQAMADEGWSSSAESSSKAQVALQQPVRDTDREAIRKTAHLHIPEACVGEVAGAPDGAFFRSVEELTGASLQLPPLAHIQAHTRLLTIHGTAESTDAAYHLVSSRLQTLDPSLLRGRQAPSADSEFSLGRKCFDAKQWRMAIAHFTVSLSLGHMDQALVHSWRGASCDGAQLFQLAFRDHDMAITGVAASGVALPAPRLWATRHFNRGLCHCKLGRLEDADADLQLSVQIDPTFGPATTELKKVQRQLNEKAELVSSMKKFLAATAKTSSAAASPTTMEEKDDFDYDAPDQSSPVIEPTQAVPLPLKDDKRPWYSRGAGLDDLPWKPPQVEKLK